MRPGMKLSVLSVCLREGTVVSRMSPKRYVDGILAILRAKRTGTLLLDGWEMAPHGSSWWSSSRQPTYISLEDVRTFEVGEVSASAEVTPEARSGLKELNRDRKAILEQAWMPRS